MKTILAGALGFALLALIGCPIPIDLSVAGSDAEITVTAEENILLPWTGAEAPLRVTDIAGFPRMNKLSVSWTLIDSEGTEVPDAAPSRRTANYTPAVTGSFGALTYRVTVGDGYVSVTEEGSVNIGEGAVISIAGPQSEAAGEEITLEANALFFSTPPALFDWSITGPSDYSFTVSHGAEYTWNSPSVPGVYTVSASAEEGGETITGTRTVTLLPPPNWSTRFDEGDWPSAPATFERYEKDGRNIGYFFAQGVVTHDGVDAMAINKTGGFRFTDLTNRTAEKMVVTLARSDDFAGEVTMRHANDADGDNVTHTSRTFSKDDLQVGFQTFEITFPAGVTAHNIDFSFHPATAGTFYIGSIAFYDAD